MAGLTIQAGERSYTKVVSLHVTITQPFAIVIFSAGKVTNISLTGKKIEFTNIL